jgi:pSer/pThr/pTyr-binding forkhead associated (FHA) protein
VLRDAEGRLAVVALPSGAGRLLVGRTESSAVPVPWDARVSRVHAWLEPVGDEWVVEDQGLSRNGTFVNEERVHGRRRLRDGDVVRVGHTRLVFRRAVADGEPTYPDGETGDVFLRTLSPTQRRVVEALVRPLSGPWAVGPPATNETIAAEVHLSVDAVKGHLRTLYRRFGLDGLPQNQKRGRLAALLRAGGVTAAPADGALRRVSEPPT